MAVDLRQQKQELRQEMKRRRAVLNEQNPDAARQLSQNFLQNVKIPSNSIIGCYIKFDSEIDPKPLAMALRAAGHIIALPIVTGKDQPLIFRQYDANDDLDVGALGTMEPRESAPVVVPDIVLVPLLAFDASRYRLGYGGGYFDRTINLIARAKPVHTIGLAYANQLVPAIPHGKFDIRLDRIVTENQIF